MLFSMFKEISAPFVLKAFDTDLIDLDPVNKKDKKEYDSIENPEDWFPKVKPEVVKGEIVAEIEKTFLKIHPTKLVYSGKDASKYRDTLILGTMLKWYNRGLECKGILDKFVSFWVAFNMIYDYLWNHHHPTQKLPSHAIRISDCICRSLDEDACKQILKPHEFILPEQMSPYELIGTPEEIKELLSSKI